MFGKCIFKGICLALMLSVSACGWHLRGSRDSDVTVTQLQLTAKDPYTPLYRVFREEYERRHIALVTDKSAPRLKLLGETLRTEIISYNTELDPAEEELTLSVNYQINDQPYRMEERKTLEKNKNRAAASESEKKILADQMRRALAEKILQQLALITSLSSKVPSSGENLP